MMILIVAPAQIACVPAEVKKAFSKKSVEYAGQGLLPEDRRFDLVDGKLKDIKVDQGGSKLHGSNGWGFEFVGNPILLYEDPTKFLVFIEPGQMGVLRGEMYGFYLIDRRTGRMIRSKKTDKNPRSMMIYKNVFYLLPADSNKKIECMSLQ